MLLTMFVISMKTSKKKLLWILGVAALLVAIFLVWPKGAAQGSAKNDKTGLKGATDTQRVAFLKSFDWEVEPQPTSVREVVIPEIFDDVYKEYNAIQLKQGFDLSKFAGQRAKRWTYSVRNYPGQEGAEGIQANVLVCDGKIIGGDICSVALDGFMHGFTTPGDSRSSSTAAVSEEAGSAAKSRGGTGENNALTSVAQQENA